MTLDCVLHCDRKPLLETVVTLLEIVVTHLEHVVQHFGGANRVAR